jgi:uncharacterized damage-inducible protein DinB
MSEKQRDSLIVQPSGSGDPEIGRGLWRLEDARRRTQAHLAGIDPAVLDWHPDWTLHSIGTLLYHIALVEADWLYVEVLGLPEEQHYPSPIGELFTYPMRTEGKLTPVMGVSYADHLHRLDTTRRTLLGVFRSMSLEEYRRPRAFPDYDVTPEWVLHHLSQHEAEHRSEMSALWTQYKKQTGG